MYKDSAIKLSVACCGRRGFLGGFCRCGGCAATLGLVRSCGRFTDQLGGHDAGDKEFRAVIVEVYRGTLHIRSGHNSQTVNVVLNGLTFLHSLHSVLLGLSFEWLG